MRRDYLLIPADDTKPLTWVKRPESQRELDWLQAQVGGYIEQVGLFRDDRDPEDDPLHQGASLWLNEEGLLRDLPPNQRAMQLALYFRGPLSQQLVGDALLEVRGHKDFASQPYAKALGDSAALVPVAAA